MKNPEESSTVDALMLLSSHCAYCPGVLDALSKLVKNGDIGSLKVINLEQHPEAMQEYKVRSVPWVKIGQYELSGSQTLETLKQKAEWAKKDKQDQTEESITNKTETNQAADFDYLLSEGQAQNVVDIIKNDPNKIQAIMDLLGDSGTVLSTRIGIGVIFEEFTGSELLKSQLPTLETLTHSEDARIRADAYHYLGMTIDNRALPLLKAGNKDSNDETREIANDAFDDLTEALQRTHDNKQ